jgi:hypothetical protein
MTGMPPLPRAFATPSNDTSPTSQSSRAREAAASTVPVRLDDAGNF